MSLKRRMRDWLNIASTGALAMLYGELGKVAGQVAGLNEAIRAIEARHADSERAWRGEQDALRSAADALRDEIDTLRGEAGSLRGEIQAVRAETDALREALAATDARFDAYAEHAYASADDLVGLRTQVDGDGKQAEALRIKLAAVAEQLRWESEDLRKGLAAIAERAERARKAG